MNDIEIYIREPVIKRVLGWLKSELGSLETIRESGKFRSYMAVENDPSFEVCLNLNVENSPYTAIWIKSGKSPWSNDIECARSAYKAFSLPVQCDPGPQSDHPDDFFRIDSDGERIVRLRDGQLGTE